ncbi:hypothetical protein CDAR_305811 [Caerostris darwini]|uniref:Uncharacterized protein n=1 Tax=Caerostris darwini TaxID=1538125 RepID=A0AAV4VTP7_9ARAC|nr:hypothetical protein CDAR_305811 [Caerostris darwini]
MQSQTSQKGSRKRRQKLIETITTFPNGPKSIESKTASFIGHREICSQRIHRFGGPPLWQFLYPGTLDEVQNLPTIFITILAFFSGYGALVQSRVPVCV